MANDPWAHSRTENAIPTPEYPEMSSRYAAPGLEEDAPYNDEFGWSPALRLSAQEIPDNSRLQERALRDFYPDGNKTPEQFYKNRDADDAARHRVEDQDANGWNEIKGIGTERRWTPNPREIPPPETRITEKLSPRSYSFLRPFKHGLGKGSVPNALNGQHFSMADHRRNYEIGGMTPSWSRRNTFRIEPTPWDTDVVDMPPNVPPVTVDARIQSVEVAYGTRNFRLS